MLEEARAWFEELLELEHSFTEEVARSPDGVCSEALSDEIDAQVGRRLLRLAQWKGQPPYQPLSGSAVFFRPPRSPTPGERVRRQVHGQELRECPAPGPVVRFTTGGTHPTDVAFHNRIFDVASIDGTLRIVAQHRVCSHCQGTSRRRGTDAPCEFHNRYASGRITIEEVCEGGRVFLGGLRLG